MPKDTAKLKQAINRFYYDMTLSELLRLNKGGPFRISYNSLLYLDLIEMIPDCTVSLLAERLHISKSAVTMKVGELQRLGLVEKVASASDRRVHYLKITPETAREYKVYDDALRRALAEIRQNYSAGDIAAFSGILTTLRRHYIERE